MKKLLPALPALSGLLVLGLTACSGGGGGGGSFQIVSCNLGCTGSGAGGDGQVSCGIQDVFVNGEIRISFSGPVEDASLSVFSVQVTQVGTGKTPAADRFVDPSNPNILVYRPKLSFDSSGAPLFGLSGGASYTVKLPGIVEDPGSQYVRNTSGTPNRHRMLCTVQASLGVLDLKPGAPTVQVTVDTVTAYDPSGDPSEFEEDVPAQGAVDVYRFSQITMVFDDVMNPATLVNPVSGESASLSIVVDPDGNLVTTTDQEPLFGTFSILLDQDQLKTTVTFLSDLGFPSAGTAATKRKIVVKFLPSIADLGDNLLANPAAVAFTPEVIAFDEFPMGEAFDTSFNEQVDATGGDWGDAVPGFLLPGIAGGSGRLGHLTLAPGQTLVLNTDAEDFASITDEDVFAPANVLDATFDGSGFVIPPVTDGVFEFASMSLSPGSKLSFVGTQPARVFVRGELAVQGVLSVAGEDLGQHDDLEHFGQPGGTAGPSGGAGGDGGRQPTWEGFEGIDGFVEPPDGVDPPTLEEINGQSGEGVPDNLLAPSGTFGAGEGGLRWPSPTAANPSYHLPTSPSDIAGVIWDTINGCRNYMPGGNGGGGAFALNGGNAKNQKPTFAALVPFSVAPNALGGDASDFGLGIGTDPDSAPRKLDPELGWLHGGAGGGGGGGNLAGGQATTSGEPVKGAFTNGKSLTGGGGQDCSTTPSSTPATIAYYEQHSSAGGGGGGGALQAQAGRVADVHGIIDASGGFGGSRFGSFGSSAAGGGGAGGGVLLQSRTVELATSPQRINIAGGTGGTGFPSAASAGGNGGAGLLRLETRSPLLTLDGELGKLAPTEAQLATVGAEPDDVYSFGMMPVQVSGPGRLSGAQSCWMRPEGNFFVLSFLEDDGDELGWDMTIIPNPPSLGPQSYRGENDLFGMSLEEVLGNELGASPLVIRFQGARIIKEVENFCDVPLDGEDAAIAPDSMTGWVSDPTELNTFFGDPSKRPNMFRFQILFDRSDPFLGAIGGIDGLTISVLPD